jgi:hypothetical protein
VTKASRIGSPGAAAPASRPMAALGPAAAVASAKLGHTTVAPETGFGPLECGSQTTGVPRTAAAATAARTSGSRATPRP